VPEAASEVDIGMNQRSYKTFLLLMLAALLTFTNTDRQLLGLSMESIKADLALSDTQLGLLTGFTFALFFTLLGIPLAQLADRRDRVWLIATTTLLGGVAISLCGFAVTFTQLILIRIAVAIGEAGLLPAANSLIPDYFTSAERPRAFAFFLMGGPISGVAGYLLGGWLVETIGWRRSFVAFGLPAVVLGVLVCITLQEPRRRQFRHVEAIVRGANVSSESKGPSLVEVSKALWLNKTFRYLTLANCAFTVVSFGMSQWIAVYFSRTYHLTTTAIGAALAIVCGGGGMVGMYAGGRFASRLTGASPKAQVQIVAFSYLGTGVMNTLLVLVSGSATLGFVLFALAGLVGASGSAPVFSIQLSIVPARMRAQSLAIQLFVVNLVGMGLGPTLAGTLSDLLVPRFGADALRWTFLSFFPGYLIATWYAVRATRTVGADLARQSIKSEKDVGILGGSDGDSGGLADIL